MSETAPRPLDPPIEPVVDPSTSKIQAPDTGERLRVTKRLVAYWAIMGAAAFPFNETLTDYTQPVAIAHEEPNCQTPTPEDYRAVDSLLRNPNLINYKAPLDYFAQPPLDDDTIRQPGDTYNSFMAMSDQFEKRIETATKQERQGITQEYFQALQQAAQNSYGLTLTLQENDEWMTLASGTLAPQRRIPTLLQKPAAEKLDYYELRTLGRTMFNVDPEFFRASGTKRIVLFDSPDNHGVAGFANLKDTIHLLYNYGGAVLHELGHNLDARICQRVSQDVLFDSINSHVTQPSDKQTHELIYFTTRHSDELITTSAFSVLIDDEPVLDPLVRAAQQQAYWQERGLVRCKVDDQYATEADQLLYTSDYHPDHGEDKAEIAELLLNGWTDPGGSQGTVQLGDALDPCKPRLFAKMREMLARLHHVAPRATEKLISNSLHTGLAFPKDGFIAKSRDYPH